MIQEGTNLVVADNTGARSARCFRILGQSRQYAHIGDIIKVSIKEAQPVGMVEETLLEHLLMQPRTIEAGGHAQLDVSAQCLIGRRGEDAVRVMPLIEHEPLEDRFPVQLDDRPLDADPTQPRVAGRPIHDDAVPFHQRDVEVIQERVGRAPQAAAILGPDTWGWCDLWTSAADAPGRTILREIRFTNFDELTVGFFVTALQELRR